MCDLGLRSLEGVYGPLKERLPESVSARVDNVFDGLRESSSASEALCALQGLLRGRDEAHAVERALVFASAAERDEEAGTGRIRECGGTGRGGRNG